MNFYLCNFIGTGTRQDPYRPSAANLPSGWSIIDLRPPGGGPSGFCLLGTNGSPTPSGGICYQLGAHVRDAVGPVIRTIIGNYLNLDLSTVTDVRDLIRVVLLSGALDGSRWLPLRPTGNRYEIILGSELVDTMPVIAGGAVARDAFTYTNGALAGNGSWANVSNSAQVESNQARNSAITVFDVARWEQDLGSTDLMVGLTVTKLVQVATKYNYAGVRMRMANPGTTDNAFAYECGWAAGTNPEQNLQRFDAGVATVLATSAIDIPRTGNFDLNGTTQGTTIRGWISGYPALSATDANYGTYQRCGMHLYTESAATDVFVDNWRAGTMYEGQVVEAWTSCCRRTI